MADKEKQVTGVGRHLVVLTLTATALLLYLLVFLYNAPLSHDLEFDGRDASRRFWLMTITQVDSSNDQISLLSSRSSPSSDILDRAIRSGDTKIVLQSSRMWGFGVLGWCSWIKDSELGNADCTTSFGWHIRKNEDIGVGTRALPGSVRHDLAICGIFLISPIISCLTVLYLLLIALKDPPMDDKLPKGWWISHKELSYGTYASQSVRNPRTAYLSLFFSLICTMTPVICAGIGVGTVDGDRYPDLAATFGTGGWCACAALFAISAAIVISVHAGLMVNTLEKKS